MKLNPEKTLVLVIDVQERLVSAMPEERMSAIVRAARVLLGAAEAMKVKVAFTEQYAKGLGHTLPTVTEWLKACDAELLDKTQFSVAGLPEFQQLLEKGPFESVVLLGMETHVCVYQTVRDLRAADLDVHVVVDGVCSRNAEHRQVGLDLCAATGAHLTTAESVVFDWLGDAKHPEFKTVSKLVR